MKRDWWNKEFRILMVFGESTTAGGWSSCRERCWAGILAGNINAVQRAPVQLLNVGVGANVISRKSPGYLYSGKPAAEERLDDHVLNYRANGALLQPDLLVISYGLNDARSGTPIDLFSGEMEDIIRRVRVKIQPLIVLAGTYYMYGINVGGEEWSKANLDTFYNYNGAIEQVAKKTDCLFVNLLESYREADWMVHHDGCHANDVGHRVLGNKIFEVLASNCSGLSLNTKDLEKAIPPWRDESTLHGKYWGT
jgi:lysophospholipase L1-like esterase